MNAPAKPSTPTQSFTLQCERMSYGPDAIAHTSDGKTVFVRGGLMGDTVLADVYEDHKNYARAVVRELIEPSSQREKSPCPYVGICGGCPWGGLQYEQQAQAKRQEILQQLTRNLQQEPSTFQELLKPLIQPGKTWGYRNKIELNRSEQGFGMTHLFAGTPLAAAHERIAVKSCALLAKPFQKLPRSVAGAVKFACGNHDNAVDRIGIRCSSRTNDVEVALWGGACELNRGRIAKLIQDSAHVSSIMRLISKGPKKARRIVANERLAGKGRWEEQLGDFRMQISAPSFFQVNTKGAEKLVELVLDGLQPCSNETAMDLYCGAGTFTLPLAAATDYVAAVEAQGPSVRDLRRHLEHYQLNNVEAIGGDALREFPDLNADIIVVDPPRAGLAQDVVRLLSEQKARALAYVSCDPATLARDLARFASYGVFAPQSITPVDLFAQSYHVECVCILTRT